MTKNRLRLPPLNAIKAFHAISRHGSIRAAADELLVTPQAVSQQIKLLEDTLQVALFERRGRSVESTEAGLVLARYVEAGFEELAEGVRRVTQVKYQNRITLNVSPYFATRYLLPQLEDFRENLPGSDLRLTTMVETPDFKRDDIDVAVQWGYGDFGDLDSSLLLHDHKMICCAPDMADQIKTPADLCAQRLLHPVLTNTLWQDILVFLGVEAADISSELAFHDAATMRRATMSAMGVGLISRVDAVQDIQAGNLVAPLGEDLLSLMPKDQIPGFYLVLPRAHRRAEGIRQFCAWVCARDWSQRPD
ncbi:LysR substrate-binding domain-containing protein [Halocynthiibacter styelae]|uniref:LysR family transcriptional regulator n=1 Tax=Halocynthiibacter styelae TaxID=2761955 RepID=A0A8J7LL19_9RHOB|nr:LysR substrate-binding domain-containing protein [Paenihalocynthiibacter styelae]MBI1495065.1 LysR family transcriptional regulator [Paenihalocynthiibacter styelae]